MILKCADCNSKLTDYEEHKYQNLLEHFGMQVRQPARCATCYYKELDRNKEKYENQNKTRGR